MILGIWYIPLTVANRLPMIQPRRDFGRSLP